jgi:prophage regulatory protein
VLTRWVAKNPLHLNSLNWSQMDAQTSAPPESFLRISQVEARVGLRKSSIYEQVRRGTFPAPIKLSRKCACWPASSIDAWIRGHINASQQAPK